MFLFTFTCCTWVLENNGTENRVKDCSPLSPRPYGISWRRAHQTAGPSPSPRALPSSVDVLRLVALRAAWGDDQSVRHGAAPPPVSLWPVPGSGHAQTLRGRQTR